jgi:endonuclease YncB( thermonuclease family)
MGIRHIIVCALFLFCTLTPLAEASVRKEIIAGPIQGDVLQVLDGDTVAVRLHVWIGQDIETHVRINGIDTPEIHGKCEEERSLAQKARSELSGLVSDRKIELTNIRLEKYAGRVLADAKTEDGLDIGKHLISKGVARAYQGEKRKPWCG